MRHIYRLQPFNLHILSDHYGVFVDLAIVQCFGSNILPLQPPQLQDISTKRSHQIAPYFKHKYNHLIDHQWFKKIEALRIHMQRDEPCHELAEALYERLISASLYGGSKIKRYPPAPYSPTIAHLRNIHRLLKLAVAQLKTKHDMTKLIARTKARLGNAGYELPDTVDQCIKALQKCTRQLKAALHDKLETRNLRQQHQDRLIKLHEDTGDSKLAKKIRGMKHVEEVKRVFQRCRKARQLGTEGGLSHVMVPTDPEENPRTCTEWTQVDCPTTMTQLLTECNRSHFGQSKGCTLTLPPLDFTMDLTATCKRADAILSGTY